MSDTTSHLIVGSANNVGVYTPESTTDLRLLGGWTIQSLAMDPTGALWCVGTAGNPARWNPVNQGWDGYPALLGGWSFNCLAWDAEGSLWCVGAAGNLSRWSGDWMTNSGGWAGPDQVPQLSLPGGWRMVAFGPDDAMWGVRQDGTIMSWSPGVDAWQPAAGAAPSDDGVLMLSFSDAMYAVTPDFQIFRSASVSEPLGWELVQTGWTVAWFGPDTPAAVNLPPAE